MLCHLKVNVNVLRPLFTKYKTTASDYWPVLYAASLEFYETSDSVTFYFIKKDPTTPESIHTKDESKRGSVFAFIFGVN